MNGQDVKTESVRRLQDKFNKTPDELIKPSAELKHPRESTLVAPVPPPAQGENRASNTAIPIPPHASANVETAKDPESVPTSPKGEVAPSGAGDNSDLVLRLFGVLVRDRPLLRPNDLDLARLYAGEIGGKMPDSPARKQAVAVQPLLKGLGSYDVPTDFKAPKVPDQTKTHFGFLHHGRLNESALITLKPNSRPTLHPFKSTGDILEWSPTLEVTGMSGSSFSFVANLSGDSLLVGLLSSGKLISLSLYSAEKMYDSKRQKWKDKQDPTAVTLPIISGEPKISISRDGKLYAFVENGAGKGPSPPIVKIRPTEGTVGSDSYDPDFRKCTDLFEERWKVSDLSFDSTGHVLVVGFQDQSTLLAFDFTRVRDKPYQIHLDKPVRAWAHSFDGKKLAVVSKSQILIEDLETWVHTGKSNPSYPPMPGSTSAELTCVAFSPKGTILATGDDAGVVGIRLSATGSFGQEVLRLDNEGAIHELGFSPDGRVLAVLNNVPDGKKPRDLSLIQINNEVPFKQGSIRLWVTKGWEENVKDSTDTASGAVPVTPPAKTKREER